MRVIIHGSIILGVGLMDVEILPRGVVFKTLAVTVVSPWRTPRASRILCVRHIHKRS